MAPHDKPGNDPPKDEGPRRKGRQGSVPKREQNQPSNRPFKRRGGASADRDQPWAGEKSGFKRRSSSSEPKSRSSFKSARPQDGRRQGPDGPPRRTGSAQAGRPPGKPRADQREKSAGRVGDRRQPKGDYRVGGPASHYRTEQPKESKGDYSKKLVATCALGLELMVGRELESLGLGPIFRDNANVSFPFSPHNVAKANYWLRTADRVWLQLAEFACRDFEELYQGVKAVDWAEMLPQDACFPVEVITTKSKLESESSCQSVSKRAVVDKMQKSYGMSTFPEIGPQFSIRVFLVNNRARVFIDTSGEGLHRRGYRTYNAQAPLRETVAAALVMLSHWSVGRELYDPMCGSGTILLEAACIGLKKAAGVERSFASQRWKFLGRQCWEEVHKEALDLYDRRGQLKLFGSDIDGKVLKLARTHLEQSGLEGRGVYFQTRDVAEFSSQKKYGVVITNPPYGRRMSSELEVEELTRTLASVFEPLSETWSLYYYSAFERFAEVYGRRSERVRKIYNGKIAANFFQYPGPKPPNFQTESDSGGTDPIRKRIPLNP